MRYALWSFPTLAVALVLSMTVTVDTVAAESCSRIAWSAEVDEFFGLVCAEELIEESKVIVSAECVAARDELLLLANGMCAATCYLVHPSCVSFLEEDWTYNCADNTQELWVLFELLGELSCHCIDTEIPIS